MNHHENFTDREQQFSSIKEDLSKHFHDSGFANLTNAADIGFLDPTNRAFDSFVHSGEDHPHGHEWGGYAQNPYFVAKDDFASFPDHYVNPGYSPNIMRPAPLSLNGNDHFGFPGSRQPVYKPNPHDYYHHPKNEYNPNHYLHSFNQPTDEYADPRQQGYPDSYDSLNIMWSEDTAKNYNKLRNISVSPNIRKQHHEFSAEPETEEEPYIHDLHDQKRHHMMGLQRGAFREHGNPMGKIPMGGQMFMNPNAEYLKSVDQRRVAGGMRNPPRPDLIQKPIGKPESYSDNEDGDDEDGEGKGRSTRGLRTLSLKVKNIVSQKKRTSYKEVAESLTNELRQKMTSRSSKEESKDEQNVKRRVYDALNVLIAADVLRKEGKTVYCDENMVHVGNATAQKGTSGEKDKLQRELFEARNRNKQKIISLHDLIYKCLAIKNLIKINKEKFEAEVQGGAKPKARTSNVNAKKIEVNQEKLALEPKGEDIIRFPFIAICSFPDNLMNLNMDKSQKQLTLESQKPFHILGDIDILLKMNFHIVSKEMFDQNFSPEIQKYLPKPYLAALKSS